MDIHQMSKVRSDAGRHNNKFQCILWGIDSKGIFDSKRKSL